MTSKGMSRERMYPVTCRATPPNSQSYLASAGMLTNSGAPALTSHTRETSNGTALDFSAEKRRTTRIAKRLSILVKGTDPLGDHFQEVTNTFEVSCHGCSYIAKRFVSKGSTLTIEVTSPRIRPSRITTGHVVWVRRPSRYKHHFEIALSVIVLCDGNVGSAVAKQLSSPVIRVR